MAGNNCHAGFLFLVQKYTTYKYVLEYKND